jgi:hypothetical protein
MVVLSPEDGYMKKLSCASVIGKRGGGLFIFGISSRNFAHCFSNCGYHKALSLQAATSRCVTKYTLVFEIRQYSILNINVVLTYRKRMVCVLSYRVDGLGMVCFDCCCWKETGKEIAT